MEFLPDFGNILYTVVAFVVALSIIVFVHEFGHYIVGRWSGIGAEVFSIGFGPRLFSWVDKRGTRWQIAAYPLGGYVRFNGDPNAASAGSSEAALAGLSAQERRKTLAGAPLWARIATVAAGPIFNFIMSIVIFAGIMIWQGTATDKPSVGNLSQLPVPTTSIKAGDHILALNGVPTTDYASLNTAIAALPNVASVDWTVDRDGATLTVAGPQAMPPRLGSVIPQSAAAQAGLQAGDVITAIDGTPIWRFEELREKIGGGDGAPVNLTIWRDGVPDGVNVTLTPKRMDMPRADGSFETRWMIGATGDMAFSPMTRPTGIGEALERGTKQVWFVVNSSVSAMKSMIFGDISSCNLRGAVGIAQGSAAAAQSGVLDFIWFIAVLSTAVGFLNLLPVPVLDGGHLLFYAWEGVTRRPPSASVLNALTAVGMVAVLSLMLFGLWNDFTC